MESNIPSPFGGEMASGCAGVLADGSVRVFPYGMDRTTFIRLGNIADGQPLGNY